MRKKIILSAAVVLFIIIVASGIGHTGKIKIGVKVVPSTSLVTVDGKPIGSSVVYLSRGKHVFKATFMDFTPDQRVVDVEQPLSLILYPRPETASALQFLADNPQIQQQRETLAGQASTDAGQAAEQKYPYLSQLPIETEDYSIYPGSPERSQVNPGETVIALHVFAKTPQGRAEAVQRIRSLGVDPSSVEIIFEDMLNVFVTESQNG